MWSSIGELLKIEIIILIRAMENCMILFSSIILWSEYQLLLDKNYYWKYYSVINVIKLSNGTCSNLIIITINLFLKLTFQNDGSYPKFE